MSEWYIIYNGQQIGPMTKENLLAYNPSRDTMVWKDGMANWQPIYTIPELMELLSGGPSVPPINPQPGVTPPKGVPNYYPAAPMKDKTTAGILAILLGGLGIQYFYLGKVGGGLVTILLSFVTCGLWSILTLVQGIMMLTMSNEEFQRKFVQSQSFMPLF